MNAVFTVSLSGASSQTVTVQYATANVTATVGSDYAMTSGTLTFTPGQLTRTVSVPVLGDTLLEPTETFAVNLSNPANATIGDGQGVGTIIDNDAPPPPPPPVTLLSLTLQPTSVKGGGTSTGTVTLSGPAPTGGLTVTLSSSDSGIAVPTSQSITVPAGARIATFTVSTSRPGSNNTKVIISATLKNVLVSTVSTTLTVKR